MVDFRKTVEVYGVVTQGNYRFESWWITSFRLYYGSNSDDLIWVTDQNDEIYTFIGNLCFFFSSDLKCFKICRNIDWFMYKCSELYPCLKLYLSTNLKSNAKG